MRTLTMTRLTVGDMMTSEVLTLGLEDSLATVRDRMYGNHIRHIPVVDGEHRLLGLVTHRDLLRQTLIERPRVSDYVEDSILEQIRVAEIMTTELETASPDTDLREAARVMLRNKFGCLPVIGEDGRLAGILTEADFLRAALYED